MFFWDLRKTDDLDNRVCYETRAAPLESYSCVCSVQIYRRDKFIPRIAHGTSSQNSDTPNSSFAGRENSGSAIFFY